MKQLGKNNVTKAVNILSESLKLYTLVLNQNSSNITKCEDNLAKCYAIVGKIKNKFTTLFYLKL